MEKLIYAILDAKNADDLLNNRLNGMHGTGGSKLYFLQGREVLAVVGDLNKAAFVPDTTSALGYAGVIENLVQDFTLLPMRFGSVMDSAAAIEGMLANNNDIFLRNLSQVNGKLEYGLKVFCDVDGLRSKLKNNAEKDSLLFSPPASANQNSVYKDYILQKLSAHRLEEQLMSFVDSVITEVGKLTDALNITKKTRKMTGESIIADCVMLMEKDKKAALIRAVEVLQNQFTDLNFILTGPWPPYSFIEFTIK